MKSTSFHRLRHGVTALVASAALVVLSACSGSDTASTSAAESPTAAASSEENSIVLVHDQQAGDGSVIDSQIAGMESYATENGWTSKNVYVADAADYESTLRNVAETGPTLIMTSFVRIADAFNAVATDYPDIKFLHLYADPVDPVIPNLLSVSYDSYKLMYVSGILAATFTDTKKVGMVMGDTQALIAADYNAFAAGVASVDPSVEVSYGVVGSYDDATKAQEVAEQLFSSGVDVVQTDAGGADAGTIAAAQAGDDRFLIASSAGVFDTAPEQTIAYSGLTFADSVLETIPMVMAEDFAGGNYATGVGSALKVVFADASPTEAVSDRFAAAQAAVEAALPSIEDGSTDIEYTTDMP